MKTTKETILRESFKLFLAKGYDGTSVPDIERAAKITRGAIFHHFINKEDIFKQSADYFVLSFLEEVNYGKEYLNSSTPLKTFMSKDNSGNNPRKLYELYPLSERSLRRMARESS